MKVLLCSQICNWKELRRRCRKHSSEASEKDPYGLLPIHWVCHSNPPLLVIKDLLEAYPESGFEVDSKGRTALHYECKYGGISVSVVEELLKNNPNATGMKDVFGRTPLFYACRNGASHDVIKTLLCNDPNAANIPSLDGRTTPLSILWGKLLKFHSQLHSLPRREQNSRHGMIMKKFGSQSCESQQQYDQEWETLMLLLQAAYRGSIAHDNGEIKNDMLHASIAVPECPLGFFHMAMRLCPHQIRNKDYNGRLPLAIAAATTRNELRDSSSRSLPPFPSILQGGYDSSDAIIIRDLLKRYPEAARVADTYGRVPIFLALECGKLWEDGVEDILKCHMDVLFTTDPQTGLYPFMFAAAAGSKKVRLGAKDNDAKQISTLYELLRECPAAISMGDTRK